MRRARGGVAALIAALAAVVMLVPASSPLQAQAQSSTKGAFVVDGRLGIALPFGSLGDLENAGLGAGLGAAYWINPRFAVRADWSLEALNGNTIPAGQSFRDMRLWHYTGGVEANLAPPVSGNVKFTVNGGLGVTTVDFSGSGPSHTYFGMTGGAKLAFPMSPQVDLYGGAQLNLTFSSSTDTFLRDVGGNLPSQLGTSSLWSLPLYGGIQVTFQ